MMYSHLLFEPGERGIVTITVNRPEKLNALSTAVIAELGDAFARVTNDAALHAVILTGAGEKAFVAGADINELAALSAFEMSQHAIAGQRVFRAIETCRKPS